jgi:hypothetical protein
MGGGAHRGKARKRPASRWRCFKRKYVFFPGEGLKGSEGSKCVYSGRVLGSLQWLPRSGAPNTNDLFFLALVTRQRKSRNTELPSLLISRTVVYKHLGTATVRVLKSFLPAWSYSYAGKCVSSAQLWGATLLRRRTHQRSGAG